LRRAVRIERGKQLNVDRLAVALATSQPRDDLSDRVMPTIGPGSIAKPERRRPVTQPTMHDHRALAAIAKLGYAVGCQSVIPDRMFVVCSASIRLDRRLD
jgi:hypothetical protein